jgi:hypothetical protein
MVISPTPLKSFSRSPPSPWGLAGTVVTLAGINPQSPMRGQRRRLCRYRSGYVEAAALADGAPAPAMRHASGVRRGTFWGPLALAAGAPQPPSDERGK